MHPSFLKKILLFTLTSLSLCGIGNAQKDFTTGILPSIGLTTPIKDEWRLTLRMESRNQLFSGQFGSGISSDFNYILTDFSILPTRKFGSTGSGGAGYLLRSRNGNYYHRLIQQYTLASNIYSLKANHRISADQTFSQAEPAEYRLRYRIGVELPFSGLVIDNREFYGKITNELLQKLQNGAYNLENRFVAVTGFQFSESHRVEYGIDYRFSSILSPNAKHTFWWQINWQISL